MQLVDAELHHIEVLKSWINNSAAAKIWGGVRFRYPYDDQTFLEDIHWQKMPTLVGVSEAGDMLAFGQYYVKFSRCHLARLIISPAYRAKGVGRAFVGQLMKQGMQRLDCQACSLYVYRDNQAAMACYRSLGFEIAEIPELLPFDDAIEFMIFNQKND